MLAGGVSKRQLLKLNLSGTLAPELGLLSHLEILDFMWNGINGTIPKEIGNITSLRLLLLNGNHISGSLPDEIGNLYNLNRLQIDLNQISGPIPKSFANLSKIKHLHMNNNSLSGQIPPELSRLPILYHFLVDNNNFSGYLPPELASLPCLKILSLRNCSLQGTIPDLSQIPRLGYFDLSYNYLNGTIPLTFSGLPKLQKLSLASNLLTGSVPSSIWQNMTFNTNATLLLDFQNNSLTDISDYYTPPANVTILDMLAAWDITLSDVFGPYELLNFTLGSYASDIPATSESGLSKNALVGILVGAVAGAIAVSVAVTVSEDIGMYRRGRRRRRRGGTGGRGRKDEEGEEGERGSKKRRWRRKVGEELVVEEEEEVALGGLQGDQNFPNWSCPLLGLGYLLVRTELGQIELFCACLRIVNTHFKVNVALRTSIKINDVKCFTFEDMVRATNNFSSSTQVGQGGYGKMLVYEFMPNGTLRDHLSAFDVKGVGRRKTASECSPCNGGQRRSFRDEEGWVFVTFLAVTSSTALAAVSRTVVAHPQQLRSTFRSKQQLQCSRTIARCICLDIQKQLRFRVPRVDFCRPRPRDFCQPSQHPRTPGVHGGWGFDIVSGIEHFHKFARQLDGTYLRARTWE
ncbi:LRR receptor-like serine threonine-protein kinase [Musa troglodytarum]|uniref:LRR receptor-like serine threonine-protein kinase n=1 Tax=Musa troglodytarum TaxID=320322 RepID=A0A9E7JW23_9LILI|nr:LRR receptor-like serine threonine-protein kinase [Musa troglodytarum]